jgi:hypothetical protein
MPGQTLGDVMRTCSIVLAGLTTAAFFCAKGLTQANDAPPVRKDGYEIKRWQTKSPTPADSVGYKTTDYETREGISPETDGNSSKITMTIGGFVKKCPTASGIASGSFEYAFTSDQVNTDEGDTRRVHLAKSIVARLEGRVGDDASIQYIDLEGEFTRGDGSPPRQIRTRFSPDQSGQPDLDSLNQAFAMTEDLSLAIVMWFVSPIFRDAMIEWSTHPCVRFSFEPPSDSIALAPGEAVTVRATVRAKEDDAIVGGATVSTNAIGGRGTVTPQDFRSEEQAATALTYTAPATPEYPFGIEMRTEKSRAGIGDGRWRALGTMAVTIEHQIAGRRDTPAAMAGQALFDGTARLEIRLEPFPQIPNHFTGEATVARPMTVGHITGKCTGSATQSEIWKIVAELDANSETLILRIANFPTEGHGFWQCPPYVREELLVHVTSELADRPLVKMSSRAGTRQEFSSAGYDFRETLIVTVH